MLKIAIHESAAAAMLVRLGVDQHAARRVLSHAPIAARFDGGKYYMPDDVEAIADCYQEREFNV